MSIAILVIVSLLLLIEICKVGYMMYLNIKQQQAMDQLKNTLKSEFSDYDIDVYSIGDNGPKIH